MSALSLVSLGKQCVCGGSLTSPCALDLKLTRKPICDLIPQYWATDRLRSSVGPLSQSARLPERLATNWETQMG